MKTYEWRYCSTQPRRSHKIQNDDRFYIGAYKYNKFFAPERGETVTLYRMCPTKPAVLTVILPCTQPFGIKTVRTIISKMFLQKRTRFRSEFKPGSAP